MTPPTHSGQRCRVIGGRMPFNGEGESPNVGRIVVTQFRHATLAGVEQEHVWRCASADGRALVTYYGAGEQADFLECWLEALPPEPERVMPAAKDLTV